MTAVKFRKTALATLFSIYTMEILMIVVVFVVFSPLLLEGNSPVISVGTSLKDRNLILGFLLAAYPLAQFFGAPLLGEFSDHWGRRPILLIATIGSGVFTVLTGLAIVWGSLWLLFVSRLVCGFFGGCTTVTTAAVADMSAPKVRGRYLAALVSGGGLGWVIGPFIGSVLSRISFAAPFWCLAVMFFVLAAATSISLAREPRPTAKLKITEAFANMASVFKVRPLITPLVSNIINLIGWMVYQAFLAAYLIQHYKFDEMWEGIAYAVSAVGWLVGSLMASWWLLKRFRAHTVTIIPFFVAGLAILSYQFFNVAGGIWPAMIAANFGQAIVQGGIVTVLSLIASAKMQGRVFGVLNAGFALAGLLGPIIAGWLAGYWLNLPFLVGALIILAMATWYTPWALRHKHQEG